MSSAELTQSQIMAVVRDAYGNAYEKNKTQRGVNEERIRIRGVSGSWVVEMWVNKTTKTVETAYPIFSNR